VVRFADDSVVGFQYKSDAERFLKELKERFQKFGLELHPEKTRLIEFGRFAAKNREERGEGKPETFTFLGFTHICGTGRNGKFKVMRHTIRKKMQTKIKELKGEMIRRMHDPIKKVGEWLKKVVSGHNQYYGVPDNAAALSLFRLQSVLELASRTHAPESERIHHLGKDEENIRQMATKAAHLPPASTNAL
jgi:RNA-directed DNA polymerase